MTMARALGVALALCLGSHAAFAHAYLEKAVPAQRATLFASPERVQLWFNERLEAAFCSLTVTDASNNKVDQGDVRVAPDNPKLLSVGLKPLTPGVYTVKFRVLSVDGHVVNNQFSFTVRGSR
jgi:copper resistance protein C